MLLHKKKWWWVKTLLLHWCLEVLTSIVCKDQKYVATLYHECSIWRLCVHFWQYMVIFYCKDIEHFAHGQNDIYSTDPEKCYYIRCTVRFGTLYKRCGSLFERYGLLSAKYDLLKLAARFLNGLPALLIR